MDTTIRNLDAKLYRQLRARAASEKRTVGGLINEALIAYLAPPPAPQQRPSIFDIPSEDWGPGNERVSAEIDEILYGGHE